MSCEYCQWYGRCGRSQSGWHMSWSCTLILDCHNITRKLKRSGIILQDLIVITQHKNYILSRKREKIMQGLISSFEPTCWIYNYACRPAFSYFFRFLLWLYCYGKIWLIPYTSDPGSCSSAGSWVNSISVQFRLRCIHYLNWDLTWTYSGFIWSRVPGVVVFWMMVTQRALHGQEFTTTVQPATLYTTDIHLTACKQVKPYLSR